MKPEKTEKIPPEERHEQSDVPLIPVIAVMAILALLSVLTLILLWILFNHFTGERAVPKSVQIDSGIEAKNEAPAPRLQDSPANDMAAWQASEEAELQRFDWVDRKRKIVKVPIERAFEILIKTKSQKDGAKDATGEPKTGLTPLELRQQRMQKEGKEEQK